MKKILGLICGLLLCTQIAQASEPAIDFVNQLTDDIITNVLASQKTNEEKLSLFQARFQKALDLKSIGQFVLGVYWRKATEQERESFLTAFIDFATKSWADRFNLYNGQKITFTGTRNAQSGQLYIDSQIQNNPPIEVIWRLRQKDGNYKIVDIIVEGVSMAMSYRNEYTTFLQKNGGELQKLITELEIKGATFKFTNQKK